MASVYRWTIAIVGAISMACFVQDYVTGADGLFELIEKTQDFQKNMYFAVVLMIEG